MYLSIHPTSLHFILQNPHANSTPPSFIQPTTTHVPAGYYHTPYPRPSFNFALIALKVYKVDFRFRFHGTHAKPTWIENR